MAKRLALAVLLGCTSDANRQMQTVDTAVAMSAGGGARDSAAVADSASRRAQDTAVVDSSVSRASSAGKPVQDTARASPDRMVLVVTVADSAAGDSLYRRAGTCQACHGARGEGVTGLGPSLDDSTWLHGDGSPAFIQRVTLDGIAVPKQSSRGMPAFASRLSAGDAYKIAAYVYTLSHAQVTVIHPFGAAPVMDTGPRP